MYNNYSEAVIANEILNPQASKKKESKTEDSAEVKIQEQNIYKIKYNNVVGRCTVLLWTCKGGVLDRQCTICCDG